MESKTSIWTVIAIVVFVVLVWWSFTKEREKQDESDIKDAVRNVCEDISLNTDCRKLGTDVVESYRGIRNDSGEVNGWDN